MNKRVIGAGSMVVISMMAIIFHALVLRAIAETENGRSPSTAIALQDGKNVGVLSAGEVRWYTFVQTGTGGALQRQMDVTLIFSPDDGVPTHQVGFQVFSADQVRRWYWDDANRMRNMGSGASVSRDGNPATGERLWSGWVVDSEAYYIQVFNNGEASIDYRLFNENVIGVELGESSAFGPTDGVPSGADPHHALSLRPGLEKGSLAAGQEVWYTLVYDDFDEDVFEPHTLTLIITPDDGRRIQRVNFDIFLADELYLWQRGDTGPLQNAGARSIVSRDGDPNTGKLLWSGWLVDGETYYARLHNDTDGPIDYWLLTADANRPELGELSAP